MRMVKVTLAVAVLPAMSVAAPEITWLAPCVVTVCGGGQLAMPEVASLHANVTVTSVVLIPEEFGGGAAVAMIIGGVRSTFTLTLAVALLPALSVTVPTIS